MLFSLKNELTDAKESLEINHERIKFLQEVLTKLNSEVEEV
jgi:cob(I)alamin adenosyltransferase